MKKFDDRAPNAHPQQQLNLVHRNEIMTSIKKARLTGINIIRNNLVTHYQLQLLIRYTHMAEFPIQIAQRTLLSVVIKLY